MSKNIITIEFNTDNAAFDSGHEEQRIIADIMPWLIDNIYESNNQETSKKIYDYNGNSVGHVKIEKIED